VYDYRAYVVRVVDGDNVILNVDLGFSTWKKASFRLVGLNAREMSEPGGPEAKANLDRILPPDTELELRSLKPDKYADRYDALLLLPGDPVSVNALLISGQWAAPWNGRGVKPLPPWPRIPEI